jgi:hypothetical protein
LRIKTTGMESREGQVYEVRCYSCDCSFAPGTRRCIHCGERIGAIRIPIGGAIDEGELQETGELEVGPPAFLRAAVWTVSVVVALLMSMFRVCGES